LAGYGFGGRIFHAPLLAAAPEVEFAGVVTRSPERRAAVERDHRVPVFDTLADLKASGAEAVAISTPAETHIPLALEAIALGLAVVVDKPFALDAAQARTAVDAAEQAGVVLSVYQNRRWDSDLLTLRRVLAEGALGEVSLFESAFERFSADPVPAAGGGIVRDFGSHLVDQALFVFGPVAAVRAEVTDERFFAVLEHERGVISHLSGDWRQGAPGPRLRVRGTLGTFVVPPGMDSQEAALIAGRVPVDDTWGTEPRERWGSIQRGDDRDLIQCERGRWDTYYPAFAAAVRGEAPVPVDPRDAIASLSVIDAVLHSVV
jgi:predicted dehydrogenase